MPEMVALTTDDGVLIKGAFRDARPARGAALLLHMMPATKESWEAFAELLASAGIASLAIDLRGHGASTEGPKGRLEYKLFDNERHQESRRDVEAGLAWLRTRLPDAVPLIAGASIGANLAIRAVAEHREIAACLALSPGLDYRGVKTDDAITALAPGQRIMLAVSREDMYAYSSLQELAASASTKNLARVELSDAGHGTAMFGRDSSFMKEAVAWLTASL